MVLTWWLQTIYKCFRSNNKKKLIWCRVWKFNVLQTKGSTFKKEWSSFEATIRKSKEWSRKLWRQLQHGCLVCLDEGGSGQLRVWCYFCGVLCAWLEEQWERCRWSNWEVFRLGNCVIKPELKVGYHQCLLFWASSEIRDPLENSFVAATLVRL